MYHKTYLNEKQRLAKKVINENKSEYLEYYNAGHKLHVVKLLKEHTGFGLKVAKEVMESIWDKDLLIDDTREIRREKLEKLAKSPLVKSVIEKIKKVDDDKLHSILLNLSIDELLTIDESLED